MISQVLRVLLLAGLLIFPAMELAAIAKPGGAALFHHQPGDCGPGPDC